MSFKLGTLVQCQQFELVIAAGEPQPAAHFCRCFRGMPDLGNELGDVVEDAAADGSLGELANRQSTMLQP